MKAKRKPTTKAKRPQGAPNAPTPEFYRKLGEAYRNQESDICDLVPVPHSTCPARRAPIRRGFVLGHSRPLGSPLVSPARSAASPSGRSEITSRASPECDCDHRNVERGVAPAHHLNDRPGQSDQLPSSLKTNHRGGHHAAHLDILRCVGRARSVGEWRECQILRSAKDDSCSPDEAALD